MFSAFPRDISFFTLDDNIVSYKNLFSSPNTILFVWATWCPYCREELERLAQKCISFNNVDIWYVNTGERKSIVQRYADIMKLRSCVKSKVILDENAFISQEFFIIALPTFIFLKNGKPVYRSYYLDEKLLEYVF